MMSRPMDYNYPIDPSGNDQHGYASWVSSLSATNVGHVPVGATASPSHPLPPHNSSASTPPPGPPQISYIEPMMNPLQQPDGMPDQVRRTHWDISGEGRLVPNRNPYEEMPMPALPHRGLYHEDIRCPGWLPPHGGAPCPSLEHGVGPSTPLLRPTGNHVIGAPLNLSIGSPDASLSSLRDLLISGDTINDQHNLGLPSLSDPDESDLDGVEEGFSEEWELPFSPPGAPTVGKKIKESYKRCNWCGNEPLRDKTLYSCAAAPCGKWVCGRCHNRHFVQVGFFCCKCVRNSSCACHTCKRVNDPSSAAKRRGSHQALTKLPGSG